MATEMSTGKTFALIFAILLIGPLMFITARFLTLGQRFEKVQVGDDVAAVKETMGPPTEEATTGLYLHGDTEYRYAVPVVPGVWVVSFKDGKVIEKQRVSGR
ncbi:MAG TPA: hypothetical protein VFS52_09155 [Steroidobacteraceae bacterium]|jgi:hypothetical protein|nr:hypothetical protein [Steroidobacteraceae bacterium]